MLRSDKILLVCEKQSEIIAELSKLVREVLVELAQYRSVENEEKLLEEIENK